MEVMFSLTAFEKLAANSGNLRYAPAVAPPALIKEESTPSASCKSPAALLLSREQAPPVNASGLLSVKSSDCKGLPVQAPKIENPLWLRTLAPLSRTSLPRDSRPICVPDQAGLAKSCSVEIQLLTFRSCIGLHTDPRRVRYAMCAGWKRKQWKARPYRLPAHGETEPILLRLRRSWQLVAEFHWGTSSAEIMRRLVSSVDGDPENIPETDPIIDEWDSLNEAGTRFVSGQPWHLREKLERESGRQLPTDDTNRSLQLRKF